MISACRAIIAWNWEKRVGEAPQGAVGIGPYFGQAEPDWTQPYDCTGGAAYVFRRELSGVEQDFYVMRDFYMLIQGYGLDPHLVHRAFLELEEFQTIIEAMGFRAGSDELGHDLENGYRSYCRSPIPKLRIFERLGAVHVWPMAGDQASEYTKYETSSPRVLAD